MRFKAGYLGPVEDPYLNDGVYALVGQQGYSNVSHGSTFLNVRSREINFKTHML
jgi:hypothetical protein